MELEQERERELELEREPEREQELEREQEREQELELEREQELEQELEQEREREQELEREPMNLTDAQIDKTIRAYEVECDFLAIMVERELIEAQHEMQWEGTSYVAGGDGLGRGFG